MLAAVVVIGCSRGTAPPEPKADFHASIVGAIEETKSGAFPYRLSGDGVFNPPDEAQVERLLNWPQSVGEELVAGPGMLLLGGQAADGSWWNQLGEFGRTADNCWQIQGGSFDRGDAIQLSSGLVVPKAPSFETRLNGQTDIQAFPGHADDIICVDEQGYAKYFSLFVGA